MLIGVSTSQPTNIDYVIDVYWIR